MFDGSFFATWAEATKTSFGFFWKSGWAFVLGYFVSAMIQAFVPKAKLTRFMGGADPRSVALATVFGAASSSCSFAALATARSLVLKGAHFVAAVAFMFASTNLVIELGILILIFLGWQYLLAEIIGGLILILISSVLIRLTYPRNWLKEAREKVEEEASAEENDFDWRERIASKEGWHMVGMNFVHDWQMVWKEILIGFTIAGFVAVLVPAEWWAAIFLTGFQDELPGWVIALENAMVGPFVAAATFIGSMGNIPLATVLNANGVLFAGIMGFIYSDLMVPPLVAVNAKYYGLRVALYIAAVMYVSIVATALILTGGFDLVGLVPESGKAVTDVVQFKMDYTFWMNLVFVGVAAVLVWLFIGHTRQHGHMHDEMEGDGPLKRGAALVAMAVLATGLLALALHGGTA
ncbi:membrane protein [Mameliella alba]|uniref:permease n=1 Tax=Mameliella TaxID=1434019 RepID=UPI000841236B|nr:MULTISPECIES: permease [Mameliella]MDD9730073.1 permease [Mameliella sp. AT18]ODM46056.1 permease [Ruegeria sp. PBVC088]BBU53872.1 membrane protein [Mameliella alba]